MDARSGASSGEARRIHPRISDIAWGVMALCVCACGVEPTQPGARNTTLLPLVRTLLEPQTSVSLRIVDGDGAPVLELSGGSLPLGLELSDGAIRGVPSRPGEHRRFEITVRDADGAPRDRRVYTLAVGVDGALTSLTDGISRDGDAVHVLSQFELSANEAFLFDPALGLAWPLQPGIAAQGFGLGSPGGSLHFFAHGFGWRGGWLVPNATLDERTDTLVQLVWDAEEAIDFDLQLVPEAALGLPAVDADFPLLERNGVLFARRAIASEQAPGAEALVLSSNLPPGRYALVAVRADGDAGIAELWISVRNRSGELAIDDRFIAFVPDLSSGSIATDLAERRQSWRALGHLTVGDGGVTGWDAPVQGSLFPPPRQSLHGASR